jgi:hypothetical protein
MVYMMLANILFLFRKVQTALEGGLDLVQPPKLARSVQYSTIRATSARKKDHFSFPMISNTYNAMADNYPKSFRKKVLDNFVAPCYNIYITIEKGRNARQPYAAQPVNISPFHPEQEKNIMNPKG